MNRKFKWISSVSMLALSVFMWGCDNIVDPVQPELQPAPMVVMSTSGKRYVVAIERGSNAESVSATIGVTGGMLALGKHTLRVFPFAVSAPTKFTMTRDAADPLRVKLTAGRNSENDVGAAGFNAPVRLGLHFANVEDAPADKSAVTVMYFRPDGMVEELNTQIDLFGRTAFATLPHFSLFGLGWP